MNGIPFRYYVNEKDTIPIFLFLEYKFEKGLCNFCDKKKTLSESYYQPLDSLCNRFCSDNKIARIIFQVLTINNANFDYVGRFKLDKK